MLTQKADQRGPGTAHDLILGGVDERVETTVEKGHDNKYIQYDGVDANHTPDEQNLVYLVRQVSAVAAAK